MDSFSLVAADEVTKRVESAGDVEEDVLSSVSLRYKPCTQALSPTCRRENEPG